MCGVGLLNTTIYFVATVFAAVWVVQLLIVISMIVFGITSSPGGNGGGSHIDHCWNNSLNLEEDLMSGASDDVKGKSTVPRNEQQLRKGTYFSQAQIDADEDRGGRYASLDKPTVTGTDPSVSYPRLPADAPSNQLAGMPPEPQLGWSVNEMELVGEKFEIERSLASSVKAAHQSEDAAVSTSPPIDGVGAGRRSFRRRI
jgi:hypothetical protein